MNYNREFHHCDLLKDTPQPMLSSGEFKNPYTGAVFCDAWVESYNNYTCGYNRAQDRATQEFYLDQRHRFVMSCISIQAESFPSSENSTFAAPVDFG